MNKKKWLGCCLLPVLVAGIGVWRGIAAIRGGKPAEERLVVVDRGTVELKVTESGTIEPLKKVEVKSKVAGRVARMTVEEGAAVRAGQLLAEIDPTEINSQVAQIRAQWAGARARASQAARGVGYQVTQTETSIEQARAALASSTARLRVALEESRVQPALTAGDVAQAEAALDSAQRSLDLLKTASHPQAVVQAHAAFEEARIGEQNAQRGLDRQKRLLSRGFASEQAVDAASTECAAARARLDQARKRADLIEDQNRLELASAESRVAEARATLQRARAASSAVQVKREEVGSARAAVRQAQAQLAAATASRRQDDMRRDDVLQARATVSQIENQLREIEVRQRDTTIIAPRSGIVTRRYVEAGELVTSGVSTFSSGTPILQVADLSRMLVKMTVNEVDVYKVRAGLPVEITVDGARGEVFRGRVRRVAPAAGSGTQAESQGQSANSVVRFAVEVVIENPDARLRPGMTARCAIIVARRQNVVRVPIQCVDNQARQSSVQLVTGQTRDGGKTRVTASRVVDAGLFGDTFVEIRKGLRPGERVKPGRFRGPKRQGFDLVHME